MPTKLVMPFSTDKPGMSTVVYVQESFDEAMNKVYPLSAPQSNLEHRANLTWTLVDGSRFTVMANNIVMMQENAWEDD